MNIFQIYFYFLSLICEAKILIYFFQKIVNDIYFI